MNYITIKFKKIPERILQNMPQKLTPVWRAVIEIGFIIFLFYSNLLMGEFVRSNNEQGKSFIFAVKDIFTITDFVIAIICAFIGYIVFEFLRKKL